VAGWARNDGDGILIHIEGPERCVSQFRHLLTRRAPKASRIADVEIQPAPFADEASFRILSSDSASPTAVSLRVPPDRATCLACRREVFDAADRRHRYPFTNCTACGPRYSIIRRLPYDRPTTSMAGFPLCPTCRGEYESPDDRRFHAEPIACPACGPRVALWDAVGRELAADSDAITAAAGRLQAGEIVALKGLGGFQLLVRADDPGAVKRLRDRKGRPTKPFAVMVPDLRTAARLAHLSLQSRRLLRSPENPIVLVKRRPGTDRLIAPEVALHLRWVGLFLPTTPLHHLLLRQLDFAVVATSGNHSEEPIVTDERDAVTRLAGLADCFLVHDRPVVRRVDDSVIRPTAAGAVMIRLARGFAPLPLPALERWVRRQNRPVSAGVLAVGGQQKAAVALWTGTQAILGPHVGDLDGSETRTAFERLTRELADLYGCSIAAVAHDLHPDYASTRWAQALGVSAIVVQHHHAHAVAVMAEHDLLDADVLAFTWDGTGLGSDGTIWGGEVLRARVDRFERVASLRPFALPGGEAAIREPARVALALAADALGFESVLADGDLLDRLGLSPATARMLLRLIERRVHAPTTTSMGRLFDGVAALCLGTNQVSYEGEAAVWLESAADGGIDREGYDLAEGDWQPVIRSVVADVRADVPTSVIASRFHLAAANWAAAVAARHPGVPVVLGGGCFQNRLLVEQTRSVLRAAGRTVYAARRVPPNDGGLAVGQLAVALSALENLDVP
jgi:hydrogenase maturation protein HypF